MKLNLNKQLAINYRSSSQRARVLTEGWVDDSIFCPNCGRLNIEKYPNNQPVADFYCSNCREEYELKSKQNSLGAKITDGAYRTMIDRLRSSNNPNFFLLNYDLQNLVVQIFLSYRSIFSFQELLKGADRFPKLLGGLAGLDVIFFFRISPRQAKSFL